MITVSLQPRVESDASSNSNASSDMLSRPKAWAASTNRRFENGNYNLLEPMVLQKLT